jgi:hypothetical protein
MWSPTKFIFSFYDFSVTYYDFSKIQPEEIKKNKTAFKTAYNRAWEVRWTVLKVGEVFYSVLKFREEKRTFAKVEGGNVDVKRKGPCPLRNINWPNLTNWASNGPIRNTSIPRWLVFLLECLKSKQPVGWFLLVRSDFHLVIQWKHGTP